MAVERMLLRRPVDRRDVLAGATGLAAGLLPATARAQLSGNAMIVTGFPAGGMGDLVSRPLAEKMRGRYAGNALVESKPGAGGRIAAAFVKKAAPDGLTILQVPSSVMTIYPHLYKDLPYDAVADFVPVTTTATYVFSFTASKALPENVKTVADFIGWARTNPTKASYGIPAAGSALHFAGMMLQRASGVELTAVPYRGGAPLLNDMLAGVIPVSFNVLGEVLPQIQAGGLRSLALCGPERSRFLPEVPTMTEQGYKDIAMIEWLGWFLPAGTPPSIATNLRNVVHDGLKEPETVAGLARLGLETKLSTSEEFTRLIKDDTARWGEIVKATGYVPAN